MNAAAIGETPLSATDVLLSLQTIERDRGRQRPFRGAARTLDLDLLLYGELELVTDGLVIPHPHLHERAFVLVPLAEIAPSVRVPGHGRVEQLASRCEPDALQLLE